MDKYPIIDPEDENYRPEILIHPERLEKLEAELADKEKQLAESRAEIERLKQLWSSNLDIINGELNKQLAEARAEIEKQDLLKQQKEGGE